MKRINFCFSIIPVLFLLATSCRKEGKVAPINPDTSTLYARTLKVYEADGRSSATLRFQSPSRELLKELALDNFEFTLVKTPAPALDPATDQTSTSAFGTVNFSSKYSNQEVHETEDRLQSNKIIYVDLIDRTNVNSVSLEVKHRGKSDNQKTDKVYSTETLYPPGVQLFFHGSTSRHRVQIDNLSSNPLNVAFYYNSCDGNTCSTNGDLKGTFTRYSGYSYTLYTNGWAWYYNCNRAVGALITIAPNTGYWYRWTLWTNCQP